MTRLWFLLVLVATPAFGQTPRAQFEATHPAYVRATTAPGPVLVVARSAYAGIDRGVSRGAEYRRSVVGAGDAVVPSGGALRVGRTRVAYSQTPGMTVWRHEGTAWVPYVNERRWR